MEMQAAWEPRLETRVGADPAAKLNEAQIALFKTLWAAIQSNHPEGVRAALAAGAGPS